MIPDSENPSTASSPVSFRDSDGCAVYPGETSWSSYPGEDIRTIHVPFVLGELDQFEMAWDCWTERCQSEMEWEETGSEPDIYIDLGSLAKDPLIGSLVSDELERRPGIELAFEVEEVVGPIDSYGAPALSEAEA